MKASRFFILILIVLFTNAVTAQTVYTTKTGSKYHKETCRYLKYSKIEHTLKDAILLGFSACSVCKPTNASKTETLKTNNNLAPQKSATALQCKGKTKSGRRCKRTTKNTNGRCYQH